MPGPTHMRNLRPGTLRHRPRLRRSHSHAPAAKTHAAAKAPAPAKSHHAAREAGQGTPAPAAAPAKAAKAAAAPAKGAPAAKGRACSACAGPCRRGQARERQEGRQGPGREDRDQAAGEHAGGPPVAAQAADRARQGTELPDLRRSQRPPAVRDRRSGADRRHRADDQRHGHPGVREGTGRRVAAHARAGRGRRRSRRGSRAGARDHGRRRIRPHHRPRPHVHARDGHGRAAHARRRDRDREAHRGRPRFRAPRAVALPADVRIHPARLRAAQGRPGPPRRHHRRLRGSRTPRT